MSRWGMTIDLDVCSGCGACAVACAQENNIPVGKPKDTPERMIRWLEIPRIEERAEPFTLERALPMPCQQCDNPPCVKVCPVNATYKNDEGLVPQIYAQCIGCRYCVNACPYTCKHFNWEDPFWPGLMERGLNPDVSVRERGVTEKCNFCAHRLQKARDAAEGKDIDPASFRTACQNACPTKAITFGDLDDPNSEVAAQARQPRAMRLLEELGTEPKVIYLKERS